VESFAGCWGKARVKLDYRWFFACFCPGMDVALTNEAASPHWEALMKRLKNIGIAITMVLLFGLIFYNLASAQGEAQPSDPAAFYKSKCVACHGPKAEKKFDASLTEEQQIDIILKGKKPEKPPNMPAYGEKGVTAEQAKALLDHMKQLRSSQ